MIDIKKKVKKPSRAIKYMLDGLLKQSKRRNFKIEMATFGSTGLPSNNICYGCAATCTVQEIAGKNLTARMFLNSHDADDWSVITAKHLSFDIEQLEFFEYAINSFRTGSPGSILNFFSDAPNYEVWNKLYQLEINMQNNNWRDQIPKVIEAIKILESYNL